MRARAEVECDCRRIESVGLCWFDVCVLSSTVL